MYFFLEKFNFSRREQEYFSINIVFRDENEKLKFISRGRAGKDEADSHGNSRERELPSLSDCDPVQ